MKREESANTAKDKAIDTALQHSWELAAWPGEGRKLVAEVVGTSFGLEEQRTTGSSPAGQSVSCELESFQ